MREGGNPDIVKHSKPFGPDNPPAKCGNRKPWSIRNAVRKILASPLCVDKLKTAQGRAELFDPVNIAKELFGNSTRTLTPAELIAVKKIQVALAGDVKAMQQLEDSADGKLVEKRISASTSLASLVTGEIDEDDDAEE